MSVRIKEVTLERFMNVNKGTVNFACTKYDKNCFQAGDILGIYGQNGSGKTAFVHALSLLKTCFLGEKLSHNAAYYIQYGQCDTSLQIVLSVTMGTEILDVFYHIIVQKSKDNNQSSAQINLEEISVRKQLGRKYKLIYSNTTNILGPKKFFDNIFKETKEREVSGYVQKGIIRSQGRSFLFSNEAEEILRKNTQCEPGVFALQVITKLKKFAREFFYIIGMQDIGLINLGILMPFHFHMEKKDKHIFGNIPLPINGASSIPEDAFRVAENFIKDMNSVLEFLIPNLQIQLKDLGSELDEQKNILRRVELLSVRGKQVFPLKYESAGIKKILSILHVFIGAFNNSSMVVAIDEFDAGVFEYLLGELLEIFQKLGKGQLVFTSHNLRPLEVLNKDFVIFTTTNPENRYVHLKNVKSNNNLRDFYYRTIVLGGQDESLYHETNQYRLQHALRKVGHHESN